MNGARTWVIGWGTPLMRLWMNAVLSGISSSEIAYCGRSVGSFTKPSPGAASWFPSAPASWTITTGPSLSVVPPPRTTTIGAQPKPYWKIRSPSKPTGWLIRTSSRRTGFPFASRSSTSDAKSIGMPLVRNRSSKSIRWMPAPVCWPEENRPVRRSPS